jgi:hypothetical protein
VMSWSHQPQSHQLHHPHVETSILGATLAMCKLHQLPLHLLRSMQHQTGNPLRLDCSEILVHLQPLP